MGVLKSLEALRENHKKGFALLIDPDKSSNIDRLLEILPYAQPDLILVGSSMLIDGNLNILIHKLKQHVQAPVVLFPGNTFQLSPEADAILFLSLISGRNPDLLIGKHVESAPWILKAGIEAIPTGYMLIDGGSPTGVSYISQTTPIPHDQYDIAIATAQAAQLLGMRLIYMDAGSGAKRHVKSQMVQKVSENIHIPLIAGGGIRGPETALSLLRSGADLIVIGNGAENDPDLIVEIGQAVHNEKWIART